MHTQQLKIKSLQDHLKKSSPIYKGHSINKFTKWHHFKIEKISNILFVKHLILNIREIFFDADIIIVMSSVNRTRSI